jgi:hypothetical protein
MSNGPTTAPGAKRRPPEQLGIVAAGDRVEHDVERPDKEIRDAKDQRLGAECRWRREGHDQHHARRREHGKSYGAFFGIESVGQPRIGFPRPPQGREEEGAAQQALARLVGGEETGDLGEGEDEDEVKEQLERREPLSRPPRSERASGSLAVVCCSPI